MEDCNGASRHFKGELLSPHSSVLLVVNIFLTSFSKKQPFFFLMTPPTWPPSSPPWISSTTHLPQHPNCHPSTPLQSMLPSPSVNGLWISTTTRWGNLKSIELPWVCSFLNYGYIIYF